MEKFSQNENNKKNAYELTSSSLEQIKEELLEYQEILASFSAGKKTVELRKRYLLKAIDKAWICAIEDTLPSLDVIIRKPGVILREREEILPVEQTRKITDRSVSFLCQHTDMINEIRDDGTVIPSKLLNVFQDDTYQSYENKFINTLLARLYAFVNKRYDMAKECGEDEKNTTLTINQDFETGNRRGKITLAIEVSEPPKDNEQVDNYIYLSDLWKRLTNLKKILDEYMSSDFVISMDRAYVRPPIMRTNKLLKNVEFRQCLSLWEFLDSYESTGYETLIAEKLEDVSEACLNDFYNTIVAQYVLFKNHITNDFISDKTLDERNLEIIKPKIKQVLDDFNPREYDSRDLIPNGTPEQVEATGEEDAIEQAVRIAILADEQTFMDTEDEDNRFKYKYRYSFMAHLILAQNPAQDFYTEIKNHLLSYNKVSSKISWNYETFIAGRKKCALIKVKGKTLSLYLPLDVSKYIDSKYNLEDVSSVKQFEAYPALYKVKGTRSLKYALELIDEVMSGYGLAKAENPIVADYHQPLQTLEQLLQKKLVKYADGTQVESTVLAENTEAQTDAEQENGKKFDYQYQYSYTARLLQSDDSVKEYYKQIKARILDYEKVKNNTSWSHESFVVGRRTIVKFKARGKTLKVYLALDAKALDEKYFVKDLSEEGKEIALPSLLQVKSERGAKYAVELVDLLMSNFGLNKAETFEKRKEINLAYQSTEQLLKNKLIKYADGTFYQKTEEELQKEKSSFEYQYTYSFSARLSQADEGAKAYYNQIKNALLGYEKVKGNMTWEHESFIIGRNAVAKIKVRGKTVKLYLALNPKTLDDKYHAKDLSGDYRKVALPTLLNVKSERGTKYAEELIEQMMTEQNLSKMENYTPSDYKAPYQTVEELLAQGKIKSAK